ncbi:hypothetical protein [Methanolapillus africanus]|uniref:hypothetical protein n=1 Tax=Methanolapillus africanus TaxID=3028297 RepID=UPI0030B8B5D7
MKIKTNIKMKKQAAFLIYFIKADAITRASAQRIQQTLQVNISRYSNNTVPNVIPQVQTSERRRREEGGTWRIAIKSN